MRGLTQLTLINSASLNYANINLNGNTLLSGANGVGKTTVLRAVLFFYHANSRKVDINSAKKKNFKEYYFSTLNSYLLYKYNNIFGVSYVLMYKTSLQTDIKYRFFRSTNEINIEDVFFENNIALGFADIIKNLRKLDVTISSTIQSGKEYRDILYDHDKSMKEFALFNTNKEYAQIHNTISNIFINSKLDSNVIKKSLVNSVEDFTPINLNQIRSNISQFLDEIKDIKAYEKNRAYIKKSLEYLVEYKSSLKILGELAKDIFAQVLYTTSYISTVEIQRKENNDLLLVQENILEKNKNTYDKRFKVLNKQEILLEDFIKRAKQKQKEYEALNIDEKIALFDKKDIYSNQLNSLNDEINLLKSTAQSEAFKYDELISKQDSLFDKFQNEKQTSINEFQKELLGKIKSLQTIQSKELKKLDDFYLEEIEEKWQELVSIKDTIKDKKYMLKSITNQEFLKDEKNNIVKIIDKNKSLEHKLKLEIQQQQNKMENLSNQIEILEINTQNSLDNISNILQQDKNILDEKIKKIQEKLNTNEDTFLGFLKDNNYKYTATLSCILKDDILFSTDLSPKISEQNKSLYGIEIDTNSLDMSLYDDAILQGKLKAYLEDIDNLKLKYETQKNRLLQDTQTQTKQLSKEKKELNKQINTLQIDLTKTITTILKETSSLNEIKQKEIEIKTDKLKQVNDEISNINSTYDIKQEQYKYIQKQFNTKIKTIKSNTTKDENLLRDEELDFTQNIKNQIKQYKQIVLSKIEQLNKQKLEVLSKKGIDTSSLKEKEIEASKLKNTLQDIEKISVIINNYNKDKEEYISLLGVKNAQLKAIVKDIEQLSFTYEKESTNIKQIIKDLKEKKERLKNEYDKLDRNLKQFKSIENQAIYNKLLAYKDDNFRCNSYEDISVIKDKIYGIDDQLKIFIQKLAKGLNQVFRNISQNNILNIYPPKSSQNEDILYSANLLKEFEDDNKIKTFQQELSSRYSLSLSHYEQEIRNLLNAQGSIQKTIRKITKKLKDLKNIKVIQKVELQYDNTEDKAVQLLIELKNLYENNAFASEINLFNPLGANNEFNQKVMDIFTKLNEYLYEHSKKEFINLDDSFVLKFRAIENGNDTGFVQILDDVGSNGTDVMIKVMVYITMLNLALEESLNKKVSSTSDNLYLHCILDEVGILSPKYLKELIHYANEQNIRFINGAPDEKIVTTYKRVYMLRTTPDHKTIVNEIVASV
jgi:hypothetical protein